MSYISRIFTFFVFFEASLLQPFTSFDGASWVVLIGKVSALARDLRPGVGLPEPSSLLVSRCLRQKAEGKRTERTGSTDTCLSCTSKSTKSTLRSTLSPNQATLAHQPPIRPSHITPTPTPTPTRTGEMDMERPTRSRRDPGFASRVRGTLPDLLAGPV